MCYYGDIYSYEEQQSLQIQQVLYQFLVLVLYIGCGVLPAYEHWYIPCNMQEASV